MVQNCKQSLAEQQIWFKRGSLVNSVCRRETGCRARTASDFLNAVPYEFPSRVGAAGL